MSDLRVHEVVFALQSPTLLNILACSSAWSLTRLDMGDASFAEAPLCQVPCTKPGATPSIVFVCSPAHWETAGRLFPKAQRVWVLHTGQPELIPDFEGICEVLVFHGRIARIVKEARPELRCHVVVPWYETAPVWSWAADLTWTVRSRPSTRPLSYPYLTRVADHFADHRIYGEDQPLGFLGPEAKLGLLRSCSGYLSALPTWVGIGLTEHECLAAGVPIVGSRWADMPENMPPEYTCLDDEPDRQVEALRRLRSDRAYAMEMSTIGLEFIRQHRSKATMDQQIAAMLQEIG
jgi:hypothetical protein